MSGQGPQVSQAPSPATLLDDLSEERIVTPGWTSAPGARGRASRYQTPLGRFLKTLTSPPAFLVLAGLLVGLSCFFAARGIWADPANRGRIGELYYERKQLVYLKPDLRDMLASNRHLSFETRCFVMVHNGGSTPLAVRCEDSSLDVASISSLAPAGEGVLGSFEDPLDPGDPPLPQEELQVERAPRGASAPLSFVLSWQETSRSHDSVQIRIDNADSSRSWDSYLLNVLVVSEDYAIDVSPQDDNMPAGTQPLILTIPAAPRLFAVDQEGGYSLYCNGVRIPRAS